MRLLTFLALGLLSLVANAGKYNDVLSIGAVAPAWTELPGADGKKHSLVDLKDKSVVVVVFTCNSCPAARDYEDRIAAFAKKHAGADSAVALVAINCNTIEPDRLDKMKERAKEKNFTFAYLYDESQKIGKAYGALFTPEFFVLDKDRKVVYMGAMDDDSNSAKVTSNHVELAVQAAQNGTPAPVSETIGRGCRIRYVKPKLAGAAS